MKTLPPLPPSDSDSINKNIFNSFYRKGARDFWGDNALETIKLQEYKQCKHYFERIGKEVRCKNCHIGWISMELRTEDGVLYVGTEKVNI